MQVTIFKIRKLEFDLKEVFAKNQRGYKNLDIEFMFDIDRY